MQRFIERDRAAIEGSPRKHPLKPGIRRSRERRSLLEALEGRCLLATFTAYPVPSSALPPTNIAVGPGGDLWFSEPSSTGPGQIGNVSSGGTVTTYQLPPGMFGNQLGPYQITAGSDGNLWMGLYTDIARASPTASGGVKFTKFAVPNVTGSTLLGRQIGGITLGPYGNVWFTGVNDADANFMGEITPTGQVTEFPIGPARAPGSITTGPDGNIWFTYSSGGGIGEVTATSSNTAKIAGYTFANGATVNRSLGDIAAGPDGNVWFTETVSGVAGLEIGKITPSGTITEYPQPTGGTNPITSGGGLTTGSDGNLYLAEAGSDQIGQVIPSSPGPPTFNQFPNPIAGSITAGGARDITLGPDGNIWYTQRSPQAIVKFSTGVTTPTPTPVPTPSGRSPL